jgi:parallel beta-helix repeat protein
MRGELLNGARRIPSPLRPQREQISIEERMVKFGRLLFSFFAFVIAPYALTSTINVPKDQPTVQAGIDAATDGDMVLVAPGTYYENLDFKGKAITVTGSGGPKVTIIDGGHISQVVRFASGEGPGSMLSGFTIQHGMSGFMGGGIYIDLTSPTIRHSVIQNNLATDGGGGIGIQCGSPLIEDNVIRNNSQRSNSEGGSGGGIYVLCPGSARIIGNRIENNIWPGSGGGISLNGAGTPLIKDNIISSNSAEWNPRSVFSQGGGIFAINDSSALIIQNLMVANRATQGAGIYLSEVEGQNPILLNNTIVGEPGWIQGGAIWVGGFDDGVQFLNNIAVGIPGAPTAGAIYCDGTFSQQPPIFTNNDAYSGNGTALQGTCASQSNQNGNISADPKFVDLVKQNYKLRAGSPAINAGTNSAPDLPKKDLAGHARIVGGTIDMGAYEYQGKKSARRQ